MLLCLESAFLTKTGLKNSELTQEARTVKVSSVLLYHTIFSLASKVEGEKSSSPEELVNEFFDLVEPKSNHCYAVLPYIKGLTEPLKRILKSHDIQVTTKPLCTLEQSSPLTKDRPSPEDQTNVVYKINCADCWWSYICETGRAFNTRRKNM